MSIFLYFIAGLVAFAIYAYDKGKDMPISPVLGLAVMWFWPIYASICLYKFLSARNKKIKGQIHV